MKENTNADFRTFKEIYEICRSGKLLDQNFDKISGFSSN